MGRRSDLTRKSYSYAKQTLEGIFGNKVLQSADEETLEQQHINMVKGSGLFDEDYYLKQNPDVKASGMDPVLHYVLHGGAEGRNPSKLFDSRFYLRDNADAREARLNPLVHYISEGLAQARPIKPRSTRQAVVDKTSKRIDIINVNFYDWTGTVLYKGGAERYVYDLAVVLKEIGYEPRIVQNAVEPFEKTYRGIPICGVATGATDAHGTSLRKMSKAFNRFCQGARLVIASPLDLACEITTAPVIGINHGIHWDSTIKHLYNNRTSDYKEIFDALARIKLGVCVDTNFINWVRTYDYELGQKLKYVPNYYDKAMFKPTKKDFTGRLKIMYPRRLYDARGIYLTLEAFDTLLKKHKDVELLLVGQTDDEAVKKAVDKAIKKYPKQVSLTEFAMEDMHKSYVDSHVVLIPTRYAEGTSLSCLEAMATNNALIATNIGGLPNLVVDGFNGRLIEPNTEALLASLESIVADRQLIADYAENGLRLVKTFEKSNWDRRWKNILEGDIE